MLDSMLLVMEELLQEEELDRSGHGSHVACLFLDVEKFAATNAGPMQVNFASLHG